ncbi:hypothetical protein NQ176_g10307 [Zarea fungicola]|uniref:Uncharacterized protein n=1 Tax=Zarea fungicola TaxID=93591 RepID=A0ACC1MHG0_9HYPO|nr:hypothetical protein NQ176_g10307 [Lecanicillium fungicola]
MAAQRRDLPCGIYAPTMTFFDHETEDLDIPTIKKHAQRLVADGLVGLVVMGSNGEAVHCTREEKLAVTKATREALDEAGFSTTPIILGATEGSVRGTIELCKLAADQGADYALILPPLILPRPRPTRRSSSTTSPPSPTPPPCPSILYQLPRRRVRHRHGQRRAHQARRAPQHCRHKVHLAATPDKLTRVAQATNAKTPSSQGSGYMAFGGMCDFTAQTLQSGGSGIIAGGANVMPKVCARVWNLYAEGKRDEAEALQKILSKGDWPLTKAAIAGTKQAIQTYFGYGGYPRRPLKRLDEARLKAIQEGTREVMEVEKSL